MDHDDIGQVDGAPAETRAGYVALVGYPNAGKSSLMNRLVEQKLSIVTPLAQTTRERVLGIDTRDGVQMVFVDTPGLVEPRYLLHKSMLHQAMEVIHDSDVVLLLVDAAAPPASRSSRTTCWSCWGGRSRSSSSATRRTRRSRRSWRGCARGRRSAFPRAALYEVSALTGDGVEALRAEIAGAASRIALPVSGRRRLARSRCASSWRSWCARRRSRCSRRKCRTAWR